MVLVLMCGSDFVIADFPGKKVGDSWGREEMWRLFQNVSLVFDELLQLLDLAAELLGGCEALCRLHKKCCHLVATQQACNTPLESVQHAGLHYS